LARAHRIDNQEFYQLLDKNGISDNIHLFNDKLRDWENYYNYDRPLGGLKGQTPYERLREKLGSAVSSKKEHGRAEALEVSLWASSATAPWL